MFLFARCLHLLLIRKWRCQDIYQLLLHRRFLPSASSSTEVRGQNRSTSILGKLRTTACWFRKNVGKDSKLAVSVSKCASFVEVNHSTVKSKDSLHFHTSSSPMEANNSKSANHSTVKSKDLQIGKSWSHSKAAKHKLISCLPQDSSFVHSWPWWIFSQANEDI